MPENNKTEEFLWKLAPCIERGDLDACVEEAVRVAQEMGMGAEELRELSAESGKSGRHDFAYVIAKAAAQGLEGTAKAKAYNNAGGAAQNLKKVKKAEDLYKKAIETDSKSASAHYNYAFMLYTLKRFEEAERHYLKAIEANPNFAEAYNNYAILLIDLKRFGDAEKYTQDAIKANPNFAGGHGTYGLLLVELDRREDAWKEIELASNIFHKTNRIVQSHLAKAWFYERYSEKNFHRKKYRESGEDAKKAGDEYLNGSETTEGDLKDALALKGNVLKAKSFVRKIPEKSWYRKILNRFGKNPDISELMDNLGEAAKYYEKASCCTAGERKDLCNACFSSISVFSEILHSMNVLIQNDDAEIDKNKWLSSLELAHKIYNDKKLINGVALVDTLRQLIKCVDELAEHRKMGLHSQEERLGKCYNNLIEVSYNLEGALKVIAEYSTEAIRDYAKKQGMGFVDRDNPEISFWDKPSKKTLLAYATIIAVIIALLQFFQLDKWALEFIKSTFFNGSSP
jgi:tetratricopeptide (TPR) repeat protein